MDKPFTSDRCSAVPEYDHAECCVRHDWLYWQGGNRRARRTADRAFYECLRTTNHWRRARLRWLGVRLGGVGFLPTPWRWGYGWRWPRSAASQPDASRFTTEDQFKAYLSILNSAALSDRAEQNEER